MVEIPIILVLGFVAAMMILLVWRGNAETKRIEAEINAAKYLKDLRHQAEEHSSEVTRLMVQTVKNKEAETNTVLELKDQLESYDGSIAALTESHRRSYANSRNKIVRLTNELSELKASTRDSDHELEQYRQKFIVVFKAERERSRLKDHEIIRLKHDLLTMTNKLKGKETEPLRYENGIPIQIIPGGYRSQQPDPEGELLEEDRRNEFHSVPGYGSSIGNGTDGDGLSLNDYAPEGMDAVDGGND